MRALAKKADELKSDEKRPHLDANKAIEARYKSVVSMLDTAMQSLKQRLTPYLTELDRRQREEAKRQQEEANRLAEQMAAAAEKAREAEADPSKSDDPIGDQIRAQEAADAAAAAQKAANKAAKTKTGVGSGSGRSMTLVEHWSAKITDHQRALWHFRDHEKVREVVQSLATAAVKADHDIKIDGVENVMEKKPR